MSNNNRPLRNHTRCMDPLLAELVQEADSGRAERRMSSNLNESPTAVT